MLMRERESVSISTVVGREMVPTLLVDSFLLDLST